MKLQIALATLFVGLFSVAGLWAGPEETIRRDFNGEGDETGVARPFYAGERLRLRK